MKFLLMILLSFCSLSIFGQEMSLEEMGPIDVSGIPEYIVYLGGLAILVIEYIIGKTKLIDPNSILETIFKIILNILKSIFTSKTDKK